MDNPFLEKEEEIRITQEVKTDTFHHNTTRHITLREILPKGLEYMCNTGIALIAGVGFLLIFSSPNNPINNFQLILTLYGGFFILYSLKHYISWDSRLLKKHVIYSNPATLKLWSETPYDRATIYFKKTNDNKVEAFDEYSVEPNNFDYIHKNINKDETNLILINIINKTYRDNEYIKNTIHKRINELTLTFKTKYSKQKKNPITKEIILNCQQDTKTYDKSLNQ